MNSENLCPLPPLHWSPVNVRAQTADRNRDGPHLFVGFLYGPVGVARFNRFSSERSCSGEADLGWLTELRPIFTEHRGHTILGISTEIPKCC